MQQSGVLRMLEGRINYAHSVFPGSSAKKQTTMTAFTRPLIPWSLSCEINKNLNRTYALSILKKKFELQPTMGSQLAVAISALILILVGPFETWA
jgi:hypothetical protein